jgi:hypothetical protein
MKESPPSLPIDRARAKACLVANLSLPGLGSLHVGRRVGWAQVGVAVSGFLLTLIFGGWFVAEWVRARELPFLAILERGELPPGFLKFLLIGLSGMGLFVIALGWAFITSLLVYQEAKSHEAR